ncbi:MAG: NUDIX hydrolase [Candidatus Obscuribacterales bacterium]|nr:NUDIX hydrolase [Candidatus Obscuribacterales bacterium]
MVTTADYDQKTTPSFKSPFQEPMCAGVIISKGKKLLFSLGDENRWREVNGVLQIPLGGIGGGQEIDESFIDCALREAAEAIGCTVSLLHSPVTYMQDELGYISEARLEELPAPLFYHRKKRKSSEPNILHICNFRARAIGQPEPKDVPGIVYVSPKCLQPFQNGIAIKDLEQVEALITLRDKISDTAQLVIDPDSHEEFIMRCYEQFAIQW